MFCENCSKRFKFKGFKIELKGKRFYLYGITNPWVLLASGEIKEIKNKGGKKVGQEGKFITKEGDEVKGILVGGQKNKSSFVEGLSNASSKNNKKLFKEMKKGEAEALKIIGKTGRSSTFRPSYFKYLEKQGIKLSEDAKRVIAVHHVVPFSLSKITSLKPLLEKAGYVIDDLQNAIGLPRIKLTELTKQIGQLKAVKNLDELASLRKKLNLPDNTSLNKIDDIVKELEQLKQFENAAGHSGSHSIYTENMKEFLRTTSKGFENLSEADQLIKINMFERKIIKVMKQLENGMSLNKIPFSN